MSSAPQQPQPQNKARLDTLLQIEERVQKQWEEAKLWELDPDHKTDAAESYLATFPYPYMNGVLHLGHAFTLAKAEFAVRYQRLRGKRALFPFGFHCTGMPICASADKLKKEVAKFGNPPQFPEEKEEDEAPKVVGEAKLEKKTGGKGKIAKKASKVKTQWGIMAEMGVAESEIHLFQDAKHWLNYFPPIAITHLKRFGLATDWRRSFITTDANPYYDSFVRWQFNTLKKKGVVQFGTRLSIFSPIDDQPCADHDRASGEGVGVQEYTLIKLRLQQPYPAAVAAALHGVPEGTAVVLPAATLRPETMYGQTNLFVLPEGEYGVYQINDKEVFVCSSRSALNMSYQAITPIRAQPKLLGTVPGTQLIGCAVKAPLAKYDTVTVLPLLTIKMDKGTGIVTSVPSDAPDDYAALMDLKNKKDFRAKYGLTDEQVLPFDVVPIINIPGMGDTAAATLCVEMKVKSQNDRKQLDEIKQKVYLDGFYKGIMLVGKYAGLKVCDAKPLVRADLIAAGDALSYAEPESLVMSRSGGECVVALADQWYLSYGEEQWKSRVVAHVERHLETFNPLAKKKFLDTLDWLHEWACSRSYGLGTRLPWDTKFVIESLSDSTVYMAYYTVAHRLQGGHLNGDLVGPAGIEAAQMTDAVWDYIFTLAEQPPADSGIARETLESMRAEFLYWYPMDLRVSGKDLIGNHLTMALYNHAAIWEARPELWPLGYFANGHANLNGEKMSKSTGNFLTMDAAVERFSADATRLSLADAGDSMEDANFAEDTAASVIARLTTMEAWSSALLADAAALAAGAPSSLFERSFAEEMDQCLRDTQTAYDQLRYHDVVKSGFFELCNARDSYIAACGSKALNKELILRWLDNFTVLMSPILPHFCQHLWEKRGNAGFVVDAPWPASVVSSSSAMSQTTYLRTVGNNLRGALARKIETVNKKKPARKPTDPEPPADVYDGAVYVAAAFPSWQQAVLQKLSDIARSSGSFPESRSLAGLFLEIPALKANKNKMKLAMQFATSAAADFATRGMDALALVSPFDEVALLTEQREYLTRGMDLGGLEIVSVNLEDETLSPEIAKALPGAPATLFALRA